MHKELTIKEINEQIKIREEEIRNSAVEIIKWRNLLKQKLEGIRIFSIETKENI